MRSKLDQTLQEHSSCMYALDGDRMTPCDLLCLDEGKTPANCKYPKKDLVISIREVKQILRNNEMRK